MAKVSLDIAEELDITCRVGDTFRLRVNLKESDGTGVKLSTLGYQFMMQVRSRRKINGVRELIIGTTSQGPLSTDGRNFDIAIDDLGNADITLSNTLMEGVDPGRHVYDLQLIESGNTTTILKGNFKVIDDISKTSNS
tara:strand:- start:46 stop:459 length:414 start_codon:yes stop_codon:yes gene_type:complete